MCRNSRSLTEEKRFLKVTKTYSKSYKNLDVKKFYEHFQLLHLLLSNFCVDEVEFPERNSNVELNKKFSCEEVQVSFQSPNCIL